MLLDGARDRDEQRRLVDARDEHLRARGAREGVDAVRLRRDPRRAVVRTRRARASLRSARRSRRRGTSRWRASARASSSAAPRAAGRTRGASPAPLRARRATRRRSRTRRTPASRVRLRRVASRLRARFAHQREPRVRRERLDHRASPCGKRRCFTTVPFGDVTARYTVPTGFSALPPLGPAMPVSESAMSAPETRLAPSAMAPRTSALTAPCPRSTSSSTPRRLRLGAVRVRHRVEQEEVARAGLAREHVADEPARCTTRRSPACSRGRGARVPRRPRTCRPRRRRSPRRAAPAPRSSRTSHAARASSRSLRARQHLHLDLGEVRAVADDHAGERLLDARELLAHDALRPARRCGGGPARVVRRERADARARPAPRTSSSSRAARRA